MSSYCANGVQLDAWHCEHDRSHSTITGEQGGIVSDWRLFVPQTAQAEIWTWSLQNLTDRTRRIDAFLVQGLDDKNFMGWRCFWDEEQQVFAKYAFPHHAHYDDYDRLRDRPNHVVLAPTIAPTSWAGRLGDLCEGAIPAEVPPAVSRGQLPSRVVSNGDPVAALHWSIELAPHNQDNQKQDDQNNASSVWRVDWLATLCADAAAGAQLRAEVAADAAAVDAELAQVIAARTAEEQRLVLARLMRRSIAK